MRGRPSGGGGVPYHLARPAHDGRTVVRRTPLKWRDGTTYYYGLDHLGGVWGMFEGGGAVANTYQYDPWGNVQNVQESVENPLQFTGREWDAGPGLLYLRNRYYDPSIARFISQDSIGLSGGINPYTYADNSPVASRDPTGLDDDVCWTITYWEYSPRSGYRIIDQKTVCEGGGRDSGGSNWFEEWLNEDSEGWPDEYAA